jgi:hypothetical protein
VVNLKQGMPLVRNALALLERELTLARSSGIAVLKIVHGYGSTGQGGEIRIAVQKELATQVSQRNVKSVIFGEDWRISNEAAWEVLKRLPALKSDPDLGRGNQGITIVVL